MEAGERYYLFFSADKDGVLEADTHTLADATHEALIQQGDVPGEGQLPELNLSGENSWPQYFADISNAGLITPSAEYRILRIPDAQPRWALWVSAEGAKDAEALTQMFFKFAETQGGDARDKSLIVQPDCPAELQEPSAEFDVESEIRNIAYLEPHAHFEIPTEPEWVNVRVGLLPERFDPPISQIDTSMGEVSDDYLESIRRLREWKEKPRRSDE